MQDALKAEGPIPGANPEATETSFADLFKKVGGRVCQPSSKPCDIQQRRVPLVFTMYILCVGSRRGLFVLHCQALHTARAAHHDD